MAFLVDVGLLFCLWHLYSFVPRAVVLTYLSPGHYLHGFELSVIRSGKMQ